MLDNWLVDDMGPPAKKKKKSITCHEFISTANSRSQTPAGSYKRTKQTSSTHQMPQQSKTNALASRRDRTSRLEEEALPNTRDKLRNQLEDSSYSYGHGSIIEVLTDDEENLFSVGDVQLNEPGIHFAPPLPFDSSSQYTLSTPSISIANVPSTVKCLRVKVRVEGVSYLVPCPVHQEDGSYTTVEWLASNMADRYFKIYGKRPVLQLLTMESALLCAADSLVDVLQQGEEVQGLVDGWETPALAEHYKTVCSKSKTGLFNEYVY